MACSEVLQDVIACSEVLQDVIVNKASTRKCAGHSWNALEAYRTHGCILHIYIHTYLCAIQFDWFELSIGGLVKSLFVRSMWCHHAVETGPAWLEPTFLGLVHTMDQTHELTHAVPYSHKHTSHPTLL